jgi:hypothetical protein
MMGKNDACVNALKELLYRTETANYENLLKIVKESNIQAILKLRKSRWVKVRPIDIFVTFLSALFELQSSSFFNISE